MSTYDYWAGESAAASAASSRLARERNDMARERARTERVFAECSDTMNGLASRVCSEIKWKTQYKASVEGWGLKADAFKDELLRIAGDTQEVRDFIARTEQRAEEHYKRTYQEFLSKEPYYQEHAAEYGK